MAKPREHRVKDSLELVQTEVDVWIATRGVPASRI